MEPHLGDWCTTDIEVRIRHHKDLDLVGQTGIIRTVSSGSCGVFLPQEDRTITIASDQLEPVIPKVGDDVKVIMGDDRESVGKLVEIDGTDYICNLDGNLTYKQQRHLCKLKQD